MKHFIIFVIFLYQVTVSPILKSVLGVGAMCRYSPSCSEYARIQIRKHGLIKGCYRSFLRILSCQPFVKQRLHSV